MVIAALRERFRSALSEMGLSPESAALESRELACFCAGIPRERYLLCAGDEAAPVRDPETLLARRRAGEPLAYLLGEWDFGGLTLGTDRRALIPRDDSEAVLALFLDELPRRPGLRLADLCAGGGCLGLAAAAARPDAAVTLCDLSADALALSAENAARCGLSDRARTLRADAFAPPPFAAGSLDGIVCNPPYLRTDEPLPDAFEPRAAFYGGADGLDFYRAVTAGWTAALAPGAPLCFEVGLGQDKAVAGLMERAGLEGLRTRKDLGGVTRAVCGRAPERG